MADDDTVITPYRDGPLLVRGPFKLLDQNGEEIPLGGRETTTALCRCGKSRCGRSATAPTTSSVSARRAAPSRAALRQEAIASQRVTPSAPTARCRVAPLRLQREAGQLLRAAEPLGHRAQFLEALGQGLRGLGAGRPCRGRPARRRARGARPRSGSRRSASSRAPARPRARPARRSAHGRRRAIAAPSASVVCASHTRSSRVPKRSVRANLEPPRLRVARPAQHLLERLP